MANGAVWDRLHGFEGPPELADIDLAFFDSDDLSPEREHAIERDLRTALPSLGWDAKTQARAHLWYPRKFGYEVPPLTSTADAVATWPETATAVALRLTGDDRLVIEAPFGLGDLLGMVHRRNPGARERRRVPPPARDQAHRGAVAAGDHRPGVASRAAAPL